MKAFFLLFVVLILSSSSVNKQKSDLDKENLKGNVKSLRQVSFYAVEKFGAITKGKRGGESLIESNDFHNKYNEKGFLIERNSYLDGTLYLIEIYTYDDNDNNIEVFQSTSEGENGKVIYNYDDKGNLIEENSYYPDDSLKASYKYTNKYDNNDNLIEQNTYLSNGSLSWREIYTYDKNGKLIENNKYQSNGSFDNKDTFKYDNNGYLIEITRYLPDSSLYYKDRYIYDEKGNPIERNYDRPSDGKFTTSFKDTYQYDYDEKNNWIKKVHFKDKIPKHIIEREIKYY